jgi:hypothetical protein
MTFVRTASMLIVVSLVVFDVRAAEAQAIAAEVQALVAEVQARGGGRGGGPATAAAGMGADPMSGPVVTGSPFSADGTTTVTQTLGDGTRIEQRATARFYRDGTGRVRRELTVIGLDALNPSAQPRTIITFDSVPGDPLPYTLDAVRRTAGRVARAALGNSWSAGQAYFAITTASPVFVANERLRTLERANDLLAQTQQLTEAERAQLRELERALTLAQSQGLQTGQAAIPGGVRPTVEDLGTRQIEGVKATGRRTTVIIPTDRVGNDRPMQITDERWESPELNLVVYTRYSDPRTGVIEYRLSNITRTEPSADLFQVPGDYTVTPAGRGRPEPGVRSGGPAGGDGGARGDGGAGAGGRRGGRSPQ